MAITLATNIESKTLPWTVFVYHALLTVFVVPITGVLIFWITPITGAALGALTTRWWRSRTVLFAWIPTTLLFLGDVSTVLRSWNIAWAQMGRWEYAKNYLVGPNCGSSECVGTVIMALLTGGLGYSIGGWLTLRQLRIAAREGK